MRAQGHRRAPSIHAPSRARKGPFPPCKWPGRSPSFQYRKRPLGPPGLGGSPPLKPANKSLAMWRESLISAFPSPAREPRAALFSRQQDRMTRAPVRASLRLSWPSRRFEPKGLRPRLQGDALSFGRHMSLNSRSIREFAGSSGNIQMSHRMADAIRQSTTQKHLCFCERDFFVSTSGAEK